MKAIFFVAFILIQTISLSFQTGYTVSNGKYFIQNKANCDYFDIEKASTDCGANLIIYPKNGNDNQKFIIKNVGSNYVTIVNVNSGLALSIENKKEGSSLEQTELKCTPNAYQLFKFIKVCDGEYLIYNKASGLYINGNSCATSQYCFRLAIQSEKCLGNIDHLIFKLYEIC